MKLVYIDPEELKPSPFHTRRSGVSTKVKELTESIRGLGVLTPLLVSSKNKILDGQLLWEASRLAEYKYGKKIELPCFIVEEQREGYGALVSYVRNVLRKPLREIDQAQQISLLLGLGWSEEEISRLSGKSIPNVNKLNSIVNKTKEYRAEAVKRLPLSKQKAFEKIKSMYKQDIDKQSKLFDFLKESSIDQVDQMKQQSSKGIPIDIGDRVGRKDLFLKKHLINIRREVEIPVIERLRRENKDLEIVIERLLLFWSNYLLCDSCDVLI